MLAQPLTPPSSLGQGHFKSDPKRYNGPEDVAKDREECQRKAPSQHSESGIRDHLSLLPMIPWRDSCVQVRQHSGASLPPRLDPACVSGVAAPLPPACGWSCARRPQRPCSGAAPAESTGTGHCTLAASPANPLGLQHFLESAVPTCLEVPSPRKAIDLLDTQLCGHTPHPYAGPDADTQSLP